MRYLLFSYTVNFSLIHEAWNIFIVKLFVDVKHKNTFNVISTLEFCIGLSSDHYLGDLSCLTDAPAAYCRPPKTWRTHWMPCCRNQKLPDSVPGRDAHPQWDTGLTSWHLQRAPVGWGWPSLPWRHTATLGPHPGPTCPCLVLQQ